MGAWGFGVFENDQACDFMYAIEKRIDKLALKKKFNSFDYEQVRASVEIIIKLSTQYRFNNETVISLFEKLNIIKSDKDWIDGWDDPNRIRKELNRQFRSFKKIIYG